MPIREAIILAGGKGTRLQSVLPDIPKCMAPVHGKPFLFYILDYLKSYEINKVIVSVGYLKEYIINNLQNNYSGIEILFSPEEKPLGTGGAIKTAFRLCENNEVFVLNGDTYFRPNLEKMQYNHIVHHAEISMAVKKIDDVSRFGTVNFDHEGKIVSFVEKQHKAGSGYINGGIYIINKGIIDSVELEQFSIENDFFKKNMDKYNFQSFISNTTFLDIGIPKDYYKASEVLKSQDHD